MPSRRIPIRKDGAHQAPLDRSRPCLGLIRSAFRLRAKAFSDKFRAQQRKRCYFQRPTASRSRTLRWPILKWRAPRPVEDRMAASSRSVTHCNVRILRPEVSPTKLKSWFHRHATRLSSLLTIELVKCDIGLPDRKEVMIHLCESREEFNLVSYEENENASMHRYGASLQPFY